MKTPDFKIIAITADSFFKNESDKITEILDSKAADLVHIRKPYADIDSISKLIELIPERFHNRLKLHDHFELIEKYQLRGPHLNSRNPVYIKSGYLKSCSLHSIEELENMNQADLLNDFEYVTLSPIYDSISKKGYRSKFSLENIKRYISGKNVVALGGITPEKFENLKKTGFIGAAMTGYFFN